MHLGTSFVLYGYVGRDHAVKVASPHRSTHVTLYNTQASLGRPVAYSILPVLHQAVPCCCDPHSMSNIEDGIRHRIGRAKPCVDEKLYPRRWLRATVRRLTRERYDCSSELVIPTVSQWLENANYPRKRKNQLAVKATKFDVTDLTLLKDSKIKAFVKREFYPEYKNARMICSRDDTAKIITGPIFKAIEERVFAHPDFIKKVPVRERSSYTVNHIGDLTGMRLYVNDHTSFETHAHTTMRDIECVVYAQFLPKALIEPISNLLCGHQYLVGDGFTANVDSRMSGEMNTSLGNGLANLMSFLLIVARKYGYAATRNVRCIIEGDDAIFAVPRYMEITDYDFRSLGFVVKIEEKQSLGSCGFCSTYFSEDGQNAIVSPMKALGAIGWTHKNIASVSVKTLAGLQSSKALSFHFEYSGTPIMHAVGCRLMDEYYDPSARISLDWYERYMIGDTDLCQFASHVPDRARWLFANVFGITESEQLSFERHCANCPIEDLLRHPVLDSLTPDVWKMNFSLYAVRALTSRPTKF